MRIVLIIICNYLIFVYNTNVLIFNKFFMENTLKRLNHIVADLTVLTQKTRLCHWNVEGPGFLDYHEFFEEYYTFLAETVDDFAERIRALDAYPVATFAEMLKISHIKENPELTSKDMITELYADTKTIADEIRSWIENEEDPISQDMYVGIVTDLDKKAWMLRSLKKTGIHG